MNNIAQWLALRDQVFVRGSINFRNETESVRFKGAEHSDGIENGNPWPMRSAAARSPRPCRSHWPHLPRPPNTPTMQGTSAVAVFPIRNTGGRAASGAGPPHRRGRPTNSVRGRNRTCGEASPIFALCSLSHDRRIALRSNHIAVANLSCVHMAFHSHDSGIRERHFSASQWHQNVLMVVRFFDSWMLRFIGSAITIRSLIPRGPSPNRPAWHAAVRLRRAAS